LGPQIQNTIYYLNTIILKLQKTTCQPLRAYSLLQRDSLDHYLNVRWPILDPNNARRTFIEYICLSRDYRVNQYLCSDTPLCYKKQVYFPMYFNFAHGYTRSVDCCTRFRFVIITLYKISMNFC